MKTINILRKNIKEAVKCMPPEYAKLCKQLKAVRAKMYKMALQEKRWL